MRKNIKKVSAVAMAMALTAVSSMPTLAVETATYTGEIAEADLTINMDLPADGSLTIKPFAGTQITTAPLYFSNKNTATTTSGEDNVSYVVGLAGYTCVATSATTENPIKVSATLPATGTAKNITAVIELGEAQDDKETDAAAFKTAFVSTAALTVDKLSEASYDGSAESVYTKNSATDDTVKVEPEKHVPFRITGAMNTAAEWEVGDEIVIVPVFSVGVEVDTVE